MESEGISRPLTEAVGERIFALEVVGIDALIAIMVCSPLLSMVCVESRLILPCDCVSCTRSVL
jgi:hypothetical protein